MEDIPTLMQKATMEIVAEMQASKDMILKERMKELHIDIDLEIEKRSRFKCLLVEQHPDKETYYYNDGSEDGLRIVTFLNRHIDTSQNYFEPIPVSGIKFELSYY